MKKVILAFGIVAVAAVSLYFATCGFGLDPAWKAGSTVVSLKLGGAVSAIAGSGSGRAVFSGDGYLYIRLGGAPSGSERFFGPYTVKAGETFTTTDISGGDYSFIAILYSTTPVDGLYFYGPQETIYYVKDVLQTDDATFRSLTNGSNFNQAFTEAACGKIIENVTIVSGGSNSISATLDPLTSLTTPYYNGDGFYWNSCYLEAPDSGTTLVRRFVMIEGLSSCTSDVFAAYTYLPNFYATIMPYTGATVTLVTMRFYDAEGKPAGITYTPGTYSDAAPASVVYYNTGNNSNYLYLEYYATGPVTISPAFSD